MLGFLQRKGGRGREPVCSGPPGAGIKFDLAPEGRVTLHRDGVVLLHIRKGMIFKSNHIGAAIWKGLAAGETLESIASTLSRDYAVAREQALEDARSFVAELEARALVTRREN